MERLFKVSSEDWKTEKIFKCLRAAEAYRYEKYGHAGYIIEYDQNGNEVANHS